MKEINLSDIPFEVADNVDVIHIHSDLSFEVPTRIHPPETTFDPLAVKIVTYRINRRK